MLKIEELYSIEKEYMSCDIKPTTVNGIEFNADDFGQQTIDGAWDNESVTFKPYDDVNEDVLTKYHITEDEYREIQDRLVCISENEYFV